MTVERITVSQVRSILEAAGMKTSKIRNKVVTSIWRGEVKQTSRFSDTLIAGELTLTEFLNKLLEAEKKNFKDIDVSKLDTNEKEIVNKIVQK